MVARRLVASSVGEAVVDGHEMRAPADDRGQPWAIEKKTLTIPKSI